MNNILDKYLKYIKSISEEQLIEELIEAGIDDYLIDYDVYMNLINSWLAIDNVIRVVEEKYGFQLYLSVIVKDSSTSNVYDCCKIYTDWMNNGGTHLSIDIMSIDEFVYHSYDGKGRIKEYKKGDTI